MGFIRRIFSRGQSLSSFQAQSLGPVMVVGMHRSGTSFLTGSLQQAGLELGQHSAWNPHNLKGNRENHNIVAFHDALLMRHGFAWDNPPDAPMAWTESDMDVARTLIAEYQDVERWGFKDPRALLAVDGWRALLPSLQFVGIFRHPCAVARSLDARGGMPEEQAFALWLSYNRHLLNLYRQQPFPLLCFDDDEHLLHDKLNQLLIELDLKPLQEDRFFSAELKHHTLEQKPLPDGLQTLYQTLCSLAR